MIVPQERNPVLAGAADVLSGARLFAALNVPWAVGAAVDGRASRWLPLGLFALAAATDFLDGRIARAAGRATRYGAALDNLADLAFVLATIAAGVAHGFVPVAVPIAIAVAFAAYVMATAWPGVRGGRWRLARSRIGHAGGVLNYALAGLIAGAVALPAWPWRPVLWAGSVVVIAVNLAAVAGRLLPAGATTPARVPPAAGSTARSRRSSA